MAWLTSLPAAVIISEERYHETRIDPDDEVTPQIRDREVQTIEYRGVDYQTANNALVSYPQASANQKRTRSMQAIGGGGYTVTEVVDTALGSWIDDPTVT